jgi:hypothetical protein
MTCSTVPKPKGNRILLHGAWPRPDAAEMGIVSAMEARCKQGEESHFIRGLIANPLAQCPVQLLLL